MSGLGEISRHLRKGEYTYKVLNHLSALNVPKLDGLVSGSSSDISPGTLGTHVLNGNDSGYVITADNHLVLLAGPQAHEWRRMQPRVQSKPFPAHYHALLALLCILPSGDPIVLQSEISNMTGCLLNET